MALIKCIDCNKEISDSINSCPHCGYKSKKLKLKGLLILIGSVIAAMSIYGIFKYDEFKIISSVKAKIESSLKDPSSVQYQNIKLSKEVEQVIYEEKAKIITVCLEYNSKNSMGGYTGYLKDTCEYRTDMQIVLSCERALVEKVKQELIELGIPQEDLAGYAEEALTNRLSSKCNF